MKTEHTINTKQYGPPEELHKKTYKIPVIWQMCGTMEIEANSLEEAKELAITDAPLPNDAEYLSDSCIIDQDGLDEIDQ